MGFGDCIFIQIPDENKTFNLLIDCGSSGPAEPYLKEVTDDIKSRLPLALAGNGAPNGKKLLDLLVVTHPHADHIKGFNPKWFKDVTIKQIWLSAFMMKDHPQAEASNSFCAMASRAVQSFPNNELAINPELNTLLQNSIWNPGAMEALRGSDDATKCLDQNCPRLYISRDIANRKNAEEQQKYKISYKDGTTCFRDFKEAETCIRVLAPEWDIDGYYLGRDTESDDLQAFSNLHGKPSRKTKTKTKENSPILSLSQSLNISKRDFNILRHRLQYSTLAFLQKDSDLKNNTSAILLIEWRGRRLLFTGDAEWEGKEVKKGRRNSSWDVLLEKDEAHGHLSKSLDFIKVSHHGSINGTPYDDDEGAPQPILDKILPEGGDAKIVVSTLAGKHGETRVVPYPNLLKELGKRASNSKKYPDDHNLSNHKQPIRTDLENSHIELLIDKNDG